MIGLNKIFTLGNIVTLIRMHQRRFHVKIDATYTITAGNMPKRYINTNKYKRHLLRQVNELHSWSYGYTQHNIARKGLVLSGNPKSHPYRTLCTSATLTIILELATTLNIWPRAEMRSYLLAQRTVSLHDNPDHVSKPCRFIYTRPSSFYSDKLACLKSKSYNLT